MTRCRFAAIRLPAPPPRGGALRSRRYPVLAAALALAALAAACNAQSLPPEAAIAAPAIVRVGEVVHLDGKGSTDPDGRSLDFAWRITNRPPESTAELSDSAAPEATFAADQPGTYEIELVVFNGDSASERALTHIIVPRCGYRPPTVVALPTQPAVPALGQSVRLAATVTDPDTLPGCGSDAAVTWSWHITQRPDRSAAVLDQPTQPNPSFEVDVPGRYEAELVVTDSAGVSSAPASWAFDVPTDEAPTPAVAPQAPPAPIAVTEDSAPHVGTLAATDRQLHDLAPLRVAFECPVRGGNAPLSYKWGFGDGHGADVADPTHVYREAGTFLATCVVTDADGDIASAAVEVDAVLDTAPVPTILGGPLDGAAPLVVDLASTVAGGNGAVRLSWDFDRRGIPRATEADPLPVRYTRPGVYEIVLRATDADGDVGEATVTVVVDAAGDSPVGAGRVTSALIGRLQPNRL